MSDDAVNKIEVSKILTMPELTVTPSNATNLSSAGTANCYIAAPNGFYTIKVNTKGNSAAPGDAINPSSVKLLWNTGVSSDEVIGLLQDVTSEGTVNFTTNRAGNAVIAAYDNLDPESPSANILWSWHIWVTDYDPNNAAGQCSYDGRGTMMDRNLGALSNTGSSDNNYVDDFGLLYQWGRKDPFIGAGSRREGNTDFAPTYPPTWPLPVTTTLGMNYAIQHPQVFLCGWASAMSSFSPDPWSSTKTIYDPCPAGWRVPDGGNDSVYEIFINSANGWDNKGRTYNNGSIPTWYPAAGRRSESTGYLESVGSSGSYWSCSLYNPNYPYYLKFDNTNSNRDYSGVGYGMSVRCQKEFD